MDKHLEKKIRELGLKSGIIYPLIHGLKTLPSAQAEQAGVVNETFVEVCSFISTVSVTQEDF